MKLALAVVLAIACKRPLEHTAPPRAAELAIDAAPIDTPLVADAATNAPPPGPVTTTVIKSEAMAGAPIVLTLAAGRDQGIANHWTVTFIADGPAVTCLIIRVDRHETLCKLQGTRLPSSVVRIAP
jgi:hypothetical protein